MVDVPFATAVTIPLTEPAIAMAVLPLLHIPNGVASVKVTDEPEQAAELPLIAAGVELTLAVVVALQPLPLV